MYILYQEDNLNLKNFGFTDPLTGIWRPKKFNIRDENNPNDGSTWSNGVTFSGSIIDPASKFLTETSLLVLHHMTVLAEEAILHQ